MALDRTEMSDSRNLLERTLDKSIMHTPLIQSLKGAKTVGREGERELGIESGEAVVSYSSFGGGGGLGRVGRAES